jgi:hypothetical protein
VSVDPAPQPLGGYVTPDARHMRHDRMLSRGLLVHEAVRPVKPVHARSELPLISTPAHAADGSRGLPGERPTSLRRRRLLSGWPNDPAMIACGVLFSYSSVPLREVLACSGDGQCGC